MKTLIKQLIPPAFVRYRYPVIGNKIALTFDDGPKPGTTEHILDILNDFKMTATFFVLGEMAESNPDLCRRMVDQGHEIGNHGYSHKKCSELSLKQIEEEINLTDRIVENITQTTPQHFRPPNGALSFPLMWLLTVNRRQPPILWSQMIKNEWRKEKDELIQEFEQMKLLPGDIVLLHDVNTQTANALPDILNIIKQRQLVGSTLSGINI